MKEQTPRADNSHSAVILIGSNISPEQNVRRVLQKLEDHISIEKCSSVWETASVGTISPNFLNLAVSSRTEYSENELKFEVLRKIEVDLGRVRTSNKYAPRTMDLDIILFDGQIVDKKIWENAFIALPIAELFPNLTNPMTGESLAKTAKRLQKVTFAVVRHDLTKKMLS